MISDEMRELLSAYVDGELRDADALRVEEMSKGDRSLRREIEQYRRLGDRLRDIDDGVEPPPTLVARLMQRVRAYADDLASRRRGRVVALLTHPVAMAAGLLVAASLGLVLARGGGSDAATVVEAPGGVTLAPVADVRPFGLEPLEIKRSRLPGEADPFIVDGVLARYALGVLVDGEVIHPRAIALRRQWEAEEKRSRRRREHAPLVKERKSRTWNPRVDAMTAPYEVGAMPLASLILISHPAGVLVGSYGPIQARRKVARDQDDIPEAVQAENPVRSRPALLLAGEILVGRNGRTRVVTSSRWLRDMAPVPVVWADAIRRPDSRDPNRPVSRLQLESVMLGPKARQRMLTAAGRDAEALAWLKKQYPGTSLMDYFRKRNRRFKSVVDRLVLTLRGDTQTTGFAIVAGGKLKGIELFASHELMMAYAPRLLYGYAAEAGAKAIDLAPKGSNGIDIERAQKLMDNLPAHVVRIESYRPGGMFWPKGMHTVTLRYGLGERVAHGLLVANSPIHLTVFGE